ncbi:MAG TPA: hypothetical protein PKN50_14325 [Spirochaetota bacterium]|nr:hypothetical protein [Spirochaetota bacterium]HPV40499.1 hypothetical protein [Spirochaetota bacterium]
MMIKTTVNIDIFVMNKIARASAVTGISKRDSISSLLKRFSGDHAKMVRSWKRVRCQGRAGNVPWKCLHLALWPDKYEFFLDLRKVCKMSVSFLIAYAVSKYLQEVIGYLSVTSDKIAIKMI